MKRNFGPVWVIAEQRDCQVEMVSLQLLGKARELADELGTDTREVIQLCVKEGIPIYKGKIDRSLLAAVMKAKGIQLRKTQVAGV